MRVVRVVRYAVAALPVLFAATSAQAHVGHDVTGFVSGFVHPLGGLDHILAMVAIGLWAGQLGGRALWAVPVSFVAAMVLGGILGMAGQPLHATELAIAVSVVVLGLVVALRLRPQLLLAVAVSGAVAVFHGHAHGIEAGATTDGVSYALGFVAATGLLHLTGIAASELCRVAAARAAVPLAGALIACIGMVLV